MLAIYFLVFLPMLRKWMLAIDWVSFCQNYSEFHPHEKALGWKKISFVGKYAKNEHFRKSLIVSDFRFSYILLTRKSYAFGLSFVAFEPVKDKEWGRQKPQVSGSDATYDTLRSRKWQIYWQKVKVEKRKSNFSLHNSFLDWTEKLTSFCSGFSEK